MIDAFGRCTECFREVSTTGGCLECNWQRIYTSAVYGQRLDGSFGVVIPEYEGPAKHYEAFLQRWKRI